MFDVSNAAVLGRGAYRTAYDMGDDLVVKQANKYRQWGESDRDNWQFSNSGIESNKKEWAIWESVKDTKFAPYFLPIFGHDDKFIQLLVPKVKVAAELTGRIYENTPADITVSDTPDALSYTKMFAEFEREIKRNRDLQAIVEPADMHWQNLALYEDRLVILDYGNFYLSPEVRRKMEPDLAEMAAKIARKKHNGAQAMNVLQRFDNHAANCTFCRNLNRGFVAPRMQPLDGGDALAWRKRFLGGLDLELGRKVQNDE